MILRNLQLPNHTHTESAHGTVQPAKRSANLKKSLPFTAAVFKSGDGTLILIQPKSTSRSLIGIPNVTFNRHIASPGSCEVQIA